MRNIGFVQCQWQYRGTLTNKKDSKITGEGRTYDNKLYTFKEANYYKTWQTLEIEAKRLDAKAVLRNLSCESDEEDKEQSMSPSHTEPASQSLQPPITPNPRLCFIF